MATPSARLPPPGNGALASAVRRLLTLALASSAAVTSSLRLPAHSSGRSRGVLASSLVVKFPERSGSPQGSRFGVNAAAAGAVPLEAAGLRAGEVCAAAAVATAAQAMVPKT